MGGGQGGPERAGYARHMSKRLQVLLPDEETRELRLQAERARMSVGQWVRRAWRAAQRQRPATDAETKREVLRRAARRRFPAGDMNEMPGEIEKGYRQ